MSYENIELFKQGIDAFNRLDVEAYAQIITPDFEWFPAMPATVEGGGYRGRSGIETYYREVRDTWSELRVTIDEYRDLGDRMVALGRLQGCGIGSGVEVDTPLGIVVEMREQKVSRSTAYFDHGEALRAAGLGD
jgi:ketosteroid isomerase-like protein